MHQLQTEAVHMKKSLLRGEIGKFIDPINASSVSEKTTAAGISTDHTRVSAEPSTRELSPERSLEPRAVAS